MQNFRGVCRTSLLRMMKQRLEKWMFKAQASWISTSWWLPCAKWVNQSVRSSGFSARSLSTKSWSRHPPQPYFHNVDVPMVGSRGFMSNLRKAHDVPVRGVITKGAHRYDIVREKVEKSIQPTRNRLLTFLKVPAPTRWSLCLCRKICRPRHSEDVIVGLGRYLCAGTVHSAPGTLEVAASSSTKRQQNVSPLGRRKIGGVPDVANRLCVWSQCRRDLCRDLCCLHGTFS